MAASPLNWNNLLVPKVGKARHSTYNRKITNPAVMGLLHTGEPHGQRKSPINSVINTAFLPDTAQDVKVPSEFMLAGIKWRVEDINHLANLGECERDTATIKLRAGLSPQIRAQTFYHELMRAVGLRNRS